MRHSLKISEPVADDILQWLSANMVVSSFAIGILGPNPEVFGTGFADGFLCILFFNIIGIIPVSFFSALGPKFGLRQVCNTNDMVVFTFND